MKTAASALTALLLVGVPAHAAPPQDPCDTIVIGHVVPGDRPGTERVVIDPPPTPEECKPQPRARVLGGRVIMPVRPGMLAYHIESFAGQSIRVPYARVVGVLEPNVFLIDGQSELPPLKGNRARVLVFIEGAALRVEPTLIVGQTVTIFGTARTLLGMHVSAEVPWPVVLTPQLVDRLEIKAAVLATAVRTADGVDLTTRASTTPR